DYIVALKDGKVVKEGSTQDIIDTKVLQDIYDMDMCIECINDNKICVYFA
ncbi:MAG: iron ABC transporter ATP-binding protein, partial [Paenibacillus sp.]